MANTFKSAAAQAIGTTNTTVYTVPSVTTTTLIGMSLANVISTNVSITVDVTITKGGTSTYLVKGAPISSGGTLVAIGGDQKLVLQTTDYISVKASAASAVDVIISMLEVA